MNPNYKTDILFVSPSFAPQLNEESIGTLILAKLLKINNFKVDILRYWECADLSCEDYSSFRHNFVKQILSVFPKLVCFYCRCTDYHVCIDFARNIKRINPDIVIAFGGPQSELVARDTLQSFDFIDYIACSEGESTIVPFANFILYKIGSESTIPGLCYRMSGDIVINTLPNLLPNNYSRDYLYYDLIPREIIKGSKSLTIDVGRGCPFSCTFCSTKTFWKQQFRLRDIEDIVRELEWVINNWGINKFDFDHDLFTVNKKKLKFFCNLIREKNLSVRWYCSSRLDTIQPEDIDYMVEAGMTNILFGVESGSTRMQKIINKNLDLSKSREIVKYSVSKGVKTKISFIYGFPEETESDFEETLKLMIDFQRLGAHIVVWRCGILNGTALYEKYKTELFLNESNEKNYAFYGFKENVDLIRTYPTIFPHFYDHPNPLRTELLYFDLFFSLWRDFARDTLDEIADEYIRSNKRLIDMYRDFVKANKIMLENNMPHTLDKYWDYSLSDCQILIDGFVENIKLGGSTRYRS